MQTRSTILWRVLVPAALAGCGGGGVGGEPGAAAGAAAPAIQAIAAARSAAPNGAAGPSALDHSAAAAASSPVGPGASMLDPLVTSRLQTELDLLEQGLRAVSDEEAAKREALEVIREVRVELDKDQPNRLRVRGLLGGLAYGVQLLEGWKGDGKFLPQLIPLV